MLEFPHTPQVALTAKTPRESGDVAEQAPLTVLNEACAVEECNTRARYSYPALGSSGAAALLCDGSFCPDNCTLHDAEDAGPSIMRGSPIGLSKRHPVRFLDSGVSGVNYSFRLTTTISPDRVASIGNVTELVVVVG